MALLSGGSSTLNPNAPLFIPTAFHQVEDFSPKWWELVKTSTWFCDYWLRQNQEDDFEGNADAEDDDVLPEAFDLDINEEFSTKEAQFEELVPSSEAKEKTGLIPTAPENGRRQLTGVELDAKALLKNLDVSTSPKERGLKYPVGPAKYQQKAPLCVSLKCTPRWIHQPR